MSTRAPVLVEVKAEETQLVFLCCDRTWAELDVWELPLER